jgi:MoaA/NifB/PqqE/SkfB family radical SAM enzyme
MAMAKGTQDLLKTLYLRQTPQEIIASELGEPYRQYRELWNQAMHFEYRPPFPIHLDLELIYGCNLKCLMCPFGVKDYQHPTYKGKELDRTLIKKIFSEGEQHGLYSVRFNGLSEPLLSKDLPDLIQMARDHGVIDTFITTNATLLTRQKSRALIKAGLNHLLISIDGSTAATYETIRIGAKYQRVIDNLYGLLEEREKLGSRRPLVRLTFVKMQINEHEIEDFIGQWLDIVDYIGIGGYLNNINNDELSEKLRTSAGTLQGIDKFHCYQPWLRGVVFANGDFFPCCANYGRDNPVDNIRERSIYEIWHSPEVRFLQDIHLAGEYYRHPVCRICVSKRDSL